MSNAKHPASHHPAHPDHPAQQPADDPAQSAVDAPLQATVELTESQIHLIARALADPRRLDLLRQIGSCCPTPKQCTTLLDATPISAATLSHHMKELETAGLIHACRNGKFVSYTLRRDVLQAYTAHLAKI